MKIWDDVREKKELMTKKGSQKFSALKYNVFPEKGDSKICSTKNVFRLPQTRRQVSAHGPTVIIWVSYA